MSDKQEKSGPFIYTISRSLLGRTTWLKTPSPVAFYWGILQYHVNLLSRSVSPSMYCSSSFLSSLTSTCPSPSPYISALAAILPRSLKQQRISHKKSDAGSTGRHCGVQGKHAATRNAPDTSRRTNPGGMYLTACLADQWATAFASGADNGFADHRP